MKKLIILFAIGLLIPRFGMAQGTVYLSNLDQTATSWQQVASNEWLAAGFKTGSNSLGYSLDSIQLDMANAAANPSGFSVMIYSSTNIGVRGGSTFGPGNSLITLSGSTDPSLAGIYSYTPASSLVLSSSTYYFIVLTAGTSAMDGGYRWSFAGANSYNPTGGWAVNNTSGVFYSGDGSTWNRSFSPDYPQFAITATPVPEPSPSWLLLLGSGIFIYVRRAFKPH